MLNNTYLVSFNNIHLLLGCAKLHHKSQHCSITLVWFKPQNDRQVLIHQILVLKRRKARHVNMAEQNSCRIWHIM